MLKHSALQDSPGFFKSRILQLFYKYHIICILLMIQNPNIKTEFRNHDFLGWFEFCSFSGWFDSRGAEPARKHKSKKHTTPQTKHNTTTETHRERGTDNGPLSLYIYIYIYTIYICMYICQRPKQALLSPYYDFGILRWSKNSKIDSLKTPWLRLTVPEWFNMSG